MSEFESEPEPEPKKGPIPGVTKENFFTVCERFGRDYDDVLKRFGEEQLLFAELLAQTSKAHDYNEKENRAFREGALLTYEVVRAQLEKENPPLGLN